MNKNLRQQIKHDQREFAAMSAVEQAYYRREISIACRPNTAAQGEEEI